MDFGAAKERRMDEKCGDIEDLERRDQQIMYSKVGDLIGKKKHNKNTAIKKADGSIPLDVEDFKYRWI